MAGIPATMVLRAMADRAGRRAMVARTDLQAMAVAVRALRAAVDTLQVEEAGIPLAEVADTPAVAAATLVVVAATPVVDITRDGCHVLRTS